jgi:phenylalanyl-tRNA synthetase beta chain
VFLPRREQPLPDEPRRVAILMSGARSPQGWQPADRAPMDFYDVKGVVEDLMDALAVGGVTFEPAAYDALRPGRTARVLVEGAQVGWIGELHPAVAERFDIKGPSVAVAEIDLDPILAKAADRKPTRPVPVYPPVREDLAFVLDRAVPVARVLEVIKAAGGSMLASAALFDEYTGEQVGAGKRSLAFSLTYQAPDRTLTDEDARKIRERVAAALTGELGAALRS